MKPQSVQGMEGYMQGALVIQILMAMPDVTEDGNFTNRFLDALYGQQYFSIGGYPTGQYFDPSVFDCPKTSGSECFCNQGTRTMFLFQILGWVMYQHDECRTLGHTQSP